MLYHETLTEFHKHNAELVGISVDGVWNAVFARDAAWRKNAFAVGKHRR
jgi:alkyl hydroperoxide reductase subunit AhpC